VAPHGMASEDAAGFEFSFQYDHTPAGAGETMGGVKSSQTSAKDHNICARAWLGGLGR